MAGLAQQRESGPGHPRFGPSTRRRYTGDERMIDLTLKTAETALKAAQAKANALGSPMTVTVVDEAGRLVLSARGDGTGFLTPETSRAKATAAAAFRRSTAELTTMGAKGWGFWQARAREALRALALAAALTAFWTLPLLARLAETRALAWGALTLDDVVRPLPLVLGALAVAAVVDRAPMSAGARLALWWLPAMIVVTALDRFAAEPLGLYWLPADRVVDGAWMALVVAGGVGAARLARRLE